MGASLCKDGKVEDEQIDKVLVLEGQRGTPKGEPEKDEENENNSSPVNIGDDDEYEQQMQNRQIEMELKRDRMEERRIVKILLLGSADSGKSTIAKQMRYSKWAIANSPLQNSESSTQTGLTKPNLSTIGEWGKW